MTDWLINTACAELQELALAWWAGKVNLQRTNPHAVALTVNSHASFPCPHFALSINTLASKYFIRTRATLGCPQTPAARLYTKHGNNGGSAKRKQQQWPWRAALAWFLGSISSSRGQSGVKTLVCPGLPWQHTVLGQKLPRLEASKWRHMSQLGLCLIALKAIVYLMFPGAPIVIYAERTPQDLHHGVWRSAHIRNVQTQNHHKYEVHSHIIMVVYYQDCQVGLVLTLAKCGLLVQHLDLENVCT